MTTKLTHECPFKDVLMPSHKEEVDPALIGRVGRVEGAVESLTALVGEQSRNIGLLGKEIGDLRDAISEGLTKTRDSFSQQLENVALRSYQANKPNWSVIVTMVALAGALGAYVLNGQTAAVSEAKTNLMKIQENQLRIEYERGKSDSFIPQASVQFKDIEDQILDLRAWRLHHSAEGSASDAEVTARQQMIKERVDKFEERQWADRPGRPRSK